MRGNIVKVIVDPYKFFIECKPSVKDMCSFGIGFPLQNTIHFLMEPVNKFMSAGYDKSPDCNSGLYIYKLKKILFR